MFVLEKIDQKTRRYIELWDSCARKHVATHTTLSFLNARDCASGHENLAVLDQK
jgi:hypothetical protein